VRPHAMSLAAVSKHLIVLEKAGLVKRQRKGKVHSLTLEAKRMLNVPRERAFKVWTAAEHIQQWMRPEPGMEVPLAMMDLRVGGKFRIQMKTPDGEFFTAVGVFQEVKVPELLVYTWDCEKDGGGAEFGEVEGKPSLVTVEFLKRGEGTELVLTHSQFAAVESRDSHARGWGKAVDSFSMFVEKE
jgi:uncharacterized protein YndB with AHSA1/START domain